MLLEKVENVKPENQQYKFAVNAKDYTENTLSTFAGNASILSAKALQL